jgi:glutathione peroxidase-family protein
MSKFSEITMNSITGEPVSFSSLKGKVSLVVNVASQ